MVAFYLEPLNNSHCLHKVEQLLNFKVIIKKEYMQGRGKRRRGSYCTNSKWKLLHEFEVEATARI